MTDNGDRLASTTIPEVNLTDPASLEAFYGNYGFFEIWRKIVLSNAMEIVRATMIVAGEKPTDKRMENLGRTHPVYLDFIGRHLEGRRMREEMVRQRMGA